MSRASGQSWDALNATRSVTREPSWWTECRFRAGFSRVMHRVLTTWRRHDFFAPGQLDAEPRIGGFSLMLKMRALRPGEMHNPNPLPGTNHTVDAYAH